MRINNDVNQKVNSITKLNKGRPFIYQYNDYLERRCTGNITLGDHDRPLGTHFDDNLLCADPPL